MDKLHKSLLAPAPSWKLVTYAGLLLVPSLIWVLLDRQVWSWDPTHYGEETIPLFRTLLHSPITWLHDLTTAVTWEGQGIFYDGAKPPLIVWIGQWFVPLRHLTGHFDSALLLSIIMTQFLSLCLVGATVLRLSRNWLMAIAVTTGLASAPLFISMSHKYMAEPIQTLAVSLFVYLMVTCCDRNRWANLVYLLGATALAISAKASSPAYCLLPGLVILAHCLWAFIRPRPEPPLTRLHGIYFLPIGLFTLLATIWTSLNWRLVLNHVLISAYSPLFGTERSFLAKLGFWFQKLHESFFLPGIFVPIALVLLWAIIKRFSPPLQKFTALDGYCLVGIGQILLVVSSLASNINEEYRYLEPLGIYLAVILTWGMIQLRGRWVSRILLGIFAAQLLLGYSQAFGAVPRSYASSYWITPLERNDQNLQNFQTILQKTCFDPLQASPGQSVTTAFGVEYSFLRQSAMPYYIQQQPAYTSTTLDYCEYPPLFAEWRTDRVEKAWLAVQDKVDFFIATDNSQSLTDLDPMPIPYSLNQWSDAFLAYLQNSPQFELVETLDTQTDARVFIFHRKA